MCYGLTWWLDLSLTVTPPAAAALLSCSSTVWRCPGLRTGAAESTAKPPRHVLQRSSDTHTERNFNTLWLEPDFIPHTLQNKPSSGQRRELTQTPSASALSPSSSPPPAARSTLTSHGRADDHTQTHRCVQTELWGPERECWGAHGNVYRIFLNYNNKIIINKNFIK